MVAKKPIFGSFLRLVVEKWTVDLNFDFELERDYLQGAKCMVSFLTKNCKNIC